MGEENINDRKILRIREPVVEQGIWKIWSNQDLRELYTDLDNAADIKRNWNGLDMVRLGKGRTVKNIFKSKPEGNRRMGRPRLRWLQDVEKYLQEMKVKRWWQKAVEREEWVSMIKEAEAHRRPYSQGVSKYSKVYLTEITIIIVHSSSSSGAEPPLIGGFDLLNDILPLCSILDTG